ncbi:MAG: lipid-A-disaccharide synthase [Alphaproteobacteria bacterium]|nr:lipid-A-disaccharide synthase [Alphaproteobacteria bacterium]
MSADKSFHSELKGKIMLAAVEPSGDEIGADLLRELKKRLPGIEVVGCGGPKMAAEGLASQFQIERLSVMGLTDAVRVLREASKRARELAETAKRERVTAAVFIDAWGFSRLCAEHLKKIAPKIKLFKLAAPQIWASRPRRVETVRRLFDGVLCLLPFEPSLFERAQVRAVFVGNPNFQRAWRERGDANRFRQSHDLGDAPLLVVAPGSRATELKRHRRPFGGAVRLLAERLEGLRVAVVVPPHLRAAAERATRKWPGAPIIVTGEEKADAFAAANAALAKSGTVTTEIAINGTAMVVAYKTDAISAFWARRIMTTPFVSILNVAAQEEIIPELLQERCRAELLAGALWPLLADEEARLDQLEAFPKLLAYLGVDAGNAASLAADKLLEWMNAPRGA